MNQSLLVCHNGRFIPCEDAAIASNDGGLLFGDSLFETLKAHRNKIQLKAQHLDRLEDAARRLDFPCPRPQLETALAQTAACLTAPVSRLRLTLTRGNHQGLLWPDSGDGNFLLTAAPYQEPDLFRQDGGAVCVSAPNQRVNPFSPLPQMKHGNYADCLYAYNRARQAGADEALFFDDRGTVLEGATSNIFALIEDRLVTPPAGTLVLDGIIRQEVIHAAAKSRLLVVEQELSRKELLGASEVFLTNSLIELLPVTSIDGQELQRGQCWATLLETLRIRQQFSL